MPATETKANYRGSNGADILPDDHAFGWWFSGPERISKHGKRNKAKVGATHLIDPRHWPRIKVASFGFHASSSPLDALIYAPDTDGLIAWLVELSGCVKHGVDSMAGGRRRYLAAIDADPILTRYAVSCVVDCTKDRLPDPDNMPRSTKGLLEDRSVSAQRGASGAGLMLAGKHSHWRLNQMLMAEIEWF